MPVRDEYAPLARIVAARAAERAPLIVGIGGGVAVGKSTAAAAVSELFPAGQVEVVATDGFLRPNAWLDAHGLMHRKGFPESYDTEGMEAFLAAVRRGDPELEVPVYDHVTYDVLPARRRISTPAVLVLEGVNALQFADRLDVPVYLHASEAAMEEWYLRRFLELCESPPPGSFYEAFAGFDEAGRRAVGHDVWTSVNLVNLRECILPTMARAHVVVEKRPDHTVGRVDVVNLIP
jgi:type I pantothenate kinase